MLVYFEIFRMHACSFSKGKCEWVKYKKTRVKLDKIVPMNKRNPLFIVTDSILFVTISFHIIFRRFRLALWLFREILRKRIIFSPFTSFWSGLLAHACILFYLMSLHILQPVTFSPWKWTRIRSKYLNVY